MAKDSSFAPPSGELLKIENTALPTPGMGLSLEANGLIPTGAFAPNPANNYVLIYDSSTGQQKWTPITQTMVTFDAWTTYTPVLGGAASLGNGTIAGRYAQLGKTVVFSGAVTFGTTTSLGAGVPSVSLPVTAGGNVGSSFGWVRAIDISAGANFAGALFPNSTTVCSIGHGAGAFTFWTTVVPFAWASTDLMFFSGTYEAA